MTELGIHIGCSPVNRGATLPTAEKNPVGRPIDHQKTQQVFDAIDLVLLKDGIGGLAIEKIAKTAGISKATLYRRFGDMEGILEAYVSTFTKDALDQALPADGLSIDDSQEFERMLTALGIQLMQLISQPRVIAFDNAMLSAGPALLSIKEKVYRNGPQQATRKIGEILARAGVKSPLFDSQSLGDLLFHVWRSGFYDELRVTGTMQMNNKELERHVTKRTRFFLRGVQKELP